MTYEKIRRLQRVAIENYWKERLERDVFELYNHRVMVDDYKIEPWFYFDALSALSFANFTMITI